MPVRIAEYVFSGELRNTRRNSVFGWIEFAPDYGIRIELTGNFSGALAGKHIRFTMPNRDARKACEPGDFPDYIENLADRQIGVVQAMDVRRATVPAMPIDDFLQLSEAERKDNLVEKECLYLEWASQDGIVVSELIEPVIEFVDDDERSRQEAAERDALNGEDFMDTGDTNSPFALPPGLDAIDDPAAEEDDDDDENDEDDPYGLFDSGLEQSVADSLGDGDSGGEDPNINLENPIPRSWDEVIPGIDPATKEMYEQWDEIFEGKKDEPISYLFPTPLQLPKADRVTTEAEAETLVKAILSQLALLSVALDVCEHFTMKQTYRLLMEEILPTAKVHPNLAASEMVQHYTTSDYCQQCDAEFEADYQARRSAEAGNEHDEQDEQPDDSSGEDE